jgi:hypothetical protein
VVKLPLYPHCRRQLLADQCFRFDNNGGADKVEIARLGQYGRDNVLEHVYCIDTKNKKKYLVVKDAAKKR